MRAVGDIDTSRGPTLRIAGTVPGNGVKRECGGRRASGMPQLPPQL